MNTRAVIFPEANRYEMCELALDEAGPGDLVVRTLVTAVSPGTERWILRGKHIGTQFPCVPGYHRIGVVEQCGSEVQGVTPGDLVYGSGNRWAGPVVSMWGAHVGLSVSAPGGYHNLGSVPPPVEKLEELAFIILCGVSNRGINRCEIREGTKTLHIGGGIVGVCAAQLAQGLGADAVVLEKAPDRIAFLRQALPEVACWSVDDPDLEGKLKAFAPEGVDILQDTVGHAPTTDRLVPFMRTRGLILLQAQYFDKQKCAIDLDQIKIRELSMTTTVGIREEDFQQTREHILSGRLKVAPLITHRLDAAHILDAYRMLDTGRPHNLGMVIHWSEV
ncbi:MAG: zinc-binding dehydrogenase [Kiritimatiellaeota bacterium]|nr:zinc-binding dehydrogenase [Kiritimatiellota bacterium]